ncbi:ABC transporter substrate-binding protein [Microbacterium sp. B35-04]|nr:ABC transporter substrate-binding protein [Microbacterium sp. B35-04]KAF2416943.1 ABC transporter substrate-binding protein [Microbacterium sp. B35-30]
MKLRKAMAVAAAAMLAAGALTSCTASADAQRETISEFPQAWDNEITIDVFSSLSNYMGMQEGWFAKIVKDKFNMKLNIIAPNVAGGGDTLFNTRVSAGDLGDLIVTDKGNRLDELIQGGLVLDAASFYPAMENLNRFDPAVQHLSEENDGMYALPTQVSSIKPWEPSEGLDPTFGPFLRWDYYKELGYPEIGTLEDLLPVLADMQAAHPTADNGQPAYALSLFKDWDGNMMVMGKQPACLYGYDELGFVLAKADGSDYQSILDSDSQYVRALRFYYEANQLGLVDPDSTTQNYDTMYSKYQNGQVLLSWWPWLGQAAYNTEANLAAGKGFMMAPLADQQIFSYGAEAYGATQVFAIGSKAEDPERVAAFLDWLYSPEGAYSGANQVSGATGPQGLTWDLADDGPTLTDIGQQVFLEGDADVPAEWGGGKYVAGASALNTTSVLPADIDPTTGLPYSYKFWPSYQELLANPVVDDWSAQMGGATSTMDYLKTNDQLLVGAGAGYAAPADDSQIETLRNQIKEIVVQYSWQLVYAENDAQFESLLTEMQNTANGLGYEKVLEVDLANAKEQNDARIAVVEAFQ